MTTLLTFLLNNWIWITIILIIILSIMLYVFHICSMTDCYKDNEFKIDSYSNLNESFFINIVQYNPGLHFMIELINKKERHTDNPIFYIFHDSELFMQLLDICKYSYNDLKQYIGVIPNWEFKGSIVEINNKEIV